MIRIDFKELTIDEIEDQIKASSQTREFLRVIEYMLRAEKNRRLNSGK